MDRSPKIPQILRIVMDMVKVGKAYCVRGNHDDKLRRRLLGSNVQIAHGLESSLMQLEQESEEFKYNVFIFLNSLVSYYVLDEGKLVVAHAGLKEKYMGKYSAYIYNFCMYGQTTGKLDEFGLPVHYQFMYDYQGKAIIVYGHTRVVEAEWVNNTIHMDTACVFGGKLTALHYPEKEIVSVRVKKVYSPLVRPFIPSKAVS